MNEAIISSDLGLRGKNGTLSTAASAVEGWLIMYVWLFVCFVCYYYVCFMPGMNALSVAANAANHDVYYV